MSIGHGVADQMLLEPGAEEVRDGGAVLAPGTSRPVRIRPALAFQSALTRLG